MKFIKVEGKIYEELSMNGGRVTLGEPTDPNREVIKEGVVWGMGKVEFDEDINYFIKTYFYVLRYFKKDVFGRSNFLDSVGKTTNKLRKV
jgi:hypothetical protein